MSDSGHNEILKVSRNLSNVLSVLGSFARQSFDEVPWLDLRKNGLRFNGSVIVAYAIDRFMAGFAKPVLTSGRV